MEQAEPSSPYVAFLENPHQLEVIDQRKLPHNEVRVRLRTVEEVKHAIEHMVVRGAPLIGICGAYAMALAGEINDDLDATKRLIDSARPTVINLSSATARMISFARKSKDNRMNMFQEVLAIAHEEYYACEKMAELGSKMIPVNPREGNANVYILHHCNTGGLATFGPGTALAAILRRQQQSPNLFVWVDETRPRLQGARLTSWELNKYKVPNSVIVDGAAGSVLASGKVDCVMVGADRVLGNGDVVNTVGTYSLAVVARENGIPVYCVAPTSSIDLTLATGLMVKVEERNESEMLEMDGKRFVDANTKAYNPAFDVTPFKYITAIVTEEMICYPPFRESLAIAKAKSLAKQQKINVDEVATDSGGLAKVQEILEQANVSKRTTTANRLFPAQNEPLEPKRQFQRVDPRPVKPRTFLGDGSAAVEPERKVHPSGTTSKPGIFGDAADASQPTTTFTRSNDLRRSQLVLGDESAAEAIGQAMSSVKIYGTSKTKTPGLFDEEQSTTKISPAKDKSKSFTSSTEQGSSIPKQPQEQAGLEEEHVPTSRGHFAAPAGQDPEPTSKRHIEPPSPTPSHFMGKEHIAAHANPEAPTTSKENIVESEFEPNTSQPKRHYVPPHLTSNVFG